MDDTKDAQDIEDVQTDSLEKTSANTSLDAFLDLEGLIKSYAAKIETIEKELKEKAQMLNDSFESDAVYREQAEKAKEANKIKNSTKQQILKRPEMAELSETVKELKFGISEDRAVLSDYLQQYQKQTGGNQIELEDGTLLEIVSVVKLIRKSSVLK